MPPLNYTQDQPKDVNSYQYAFIDLRRIGSFWNPLQQTCYQFIAEDGEYSLHDSQPFRSWYSADGIAAYNQMQNYAVQNGWEKDGTVYSPLQRENLQRYRKRKRTD